MAGRILIVDDDPPIRTLLSLIARRAGFVADVAQDGTEALAMLERESYAVMLLDLMMPRLNGFEVIDALRARTQRPTVIVVTAMTASITAELDPQVVHGVLHKPFDVDIVATLLIDCARHRGEIDAVTLPPPRKRAEDFAC